MTSISGMRSLRATCGRAGLPVPPVPKDLADRVTKLAQWVYSTRRASDIDLVGLYMLRPEVTRLLLGGQPDQVTFAHTGHGVNSYAICYSLSWHNLVLVVQYFWGGIYMDNDREAARMREPFSLVRCLVERDPTGRQLRGHRLAVAASPIRRYSRFDLVPRQLPESAAAAWVNGHDEWDRKDAYYDALRAALEWLDSGSPFPVPRHQASDEKSAT